jgi:hypothetical protein
MRRGALLRDFARMILPFLDVQGLDVLAAYIRPGA